MKNLIIFADPFGHNLPFDQLIKNVEHTENIAFRLDSLGPYKMIKEFLAWYYSIKADVMFVVTKFPNILNFVGELVSEGVIHCDKVTIVLIQEDGSKQQFFYNIEGYIPRWPLGIMDGIHVEGAVDLAKKYKDLYSDES